MMMHPTTLKKKHYWIDANTTIVGYFSTPLSPKDRSFRHKY
jgi:hypothetical protein